MLGLPIALVLLCTGRSFLLSDPALGDDDIRAYEAAVYCSRMSAVRATTSAASNDDEQCMHSRAIFTPDWWCDEDTAEYLSDCDSAADTSPGESDDDGSGSESQETNDAAESDKHVWKSEAEASSYDSAGEETARLLQDFAALGVIHKARDPKSIEHILPLA